MFHIFFIVVSQTSI